MTIFIALLVVVGCKPEEVVEEVLKPEVSLVFPQDGDVISVNELSFEATLLEPDVEVEPESLYWFSSVDGPLVGESRVSSDGEGTLGITLEQPLSTGGHAFSVVVHDVLGNEARDSAMIFVEE